MSFLSALASPLRWGSSAPAGGVDWAFGLDRPSDAVPGWGVMGVWQLPVRTHLSVCVCCQAMTPQRRKVVLQSSWMLGSEDVLEVGE